MKAQSTFETPFGPGLNCVGRAETCKAVSIRLSYNRLSSCDAQRLYTTTSLVRLWWATLYGKQSLAGIFEKWQRYGSILHIWNITGKPEILYSQRQYVKDYIYDMIYMIIYIWQDRLPVMSSTLAHSYLAWVGILTSYLLSGSFDLYLNFTSIEYLIVIFLPLFQLLQTRI